MSTSHYAEHYVDENGELIVKNKYGQQLYRVGSRDGTCQDWGCVSHDDAECRAWAEQTCCPGCPDRDNCYSLKWV